MPGVERFLVVGLGNPGPGYARTRHNAGFMVLDELAKAEGLAFRARGEAAIAEWGRGWLMKPLTYMNLSGRAVAPFVRKKGIPLERLLVVHDDLDLPLGRLRLKRGGSAGGQKGVASIIGVSRCRLQRFASICVGTTTIMGPGVWWMIDPTQLFPHSVLPICVPAISTTRRAGCSTLRQRMISRR